MSLRRLGASPLTSLLSAAPGPLHVLNASHDWIYIYEWTKKTSKWGIKPCCVMASTRYGVNLVILVQSAAVGLFEHPEQHDAQSRSMILCATAYIL